MYNVHGYVKHVIKYFIGRWKLMSSTLGDRISFCYTEICAWSHILCARFCVTFPHKTNLKMKKLKSVLSSTIITRCPIGIIEILMKIFNRYLIIYYINFSLIVGIQSSKWLKFCTYSNAQKIHFHDAKFSVNFSMYNFSNFKFDIEYLMIIVPALYM